MEETDSEDTETPKETSNEGETICSQYNDSGKCNSPVMSLKGSDKSKLSSGRISNVPTDNPYLYYVDPQQRQNVEECEAEDDEENQAKLFLDDDPSHLCSNLVQGRIATGLVWSGTECLIRINSLLKTKNITDSTDSLNKIYRLWYLYLRKSPQGIFLKEIPNVMVIIETLANEYPNSEIGSNVFKMMIPQTKKMLQLQAQSDRLEFQCLSNALDVVGNILANGSEEFQIGLSQILLSWIVIFEEKTIKLPKGCLIENRETKTTKPLSLKLFVSALEKSTICKTLALVMIDSKLNENIYFDVLEILKFACENSQLIADKMIKRPILEPVLAKLGNEDNSNIILTRSIDFMYALFSKLIQKQESENVDSKAGCLKTIPTPSYRSFQILLLRFGELMISADSKFLLELRNDVAFTIYFMTKQIPGLRKHNNNNFATYICEILNANILVQREDLPQLPVPLQLDAIPEDWEMLNYFIGWLGIIVHSSFAKKLIYDYELVQVFAKIVLLKVDTPLLDVLYDNPELQPQLLDTAWNALEIIAEEEPLAFVRQDDVGLIEHLKVMARFRQTPVGEQLNFKHNLCKLSHILRMVLSHEGQSCMTEILEYFKNQQAMETFAHVLKEMSVSFFEIVEESAICNILLSCAIICDLDASEKNSFIQAKGIQVLTRLTTQLVVHPAKDRHMNPLLHIALAECVSKCVAYSTSAMEMFLAYEGVLNMLDLLEVAAGPSASMHIITCLLELCEYSRCMDQLLFWQRTGRRHLQRHSHNQQFNYSFTQGILNKTVKPDQGDKIGDYITSRDHTLSALLCDIWREEEKRLGVLRDSDGCIASIEQSLMSEFARNYTSLWKRSKGRIKPAEYPGASCLDLMASVRPKIFLLVKKITEETNTEATVFGGLGVQNQVTMQIIINFLDLKRGEIWLEMIQELENDNVQLVANDQKSIEIFHRIGRNKVAAVLDTQQYLIRRAKEHDEITERELYALMKECTLQDHLLAAKEVQYLARSSNYLFMVEKRLWQKAQLRHFVIPRLEQNARLHRTTDSSLNCTVWPGGTREVISEPNLQKGRTLPMDPGEVESSVLANILMKDTSTAVPSLLSSLHLSDNEVSQDDLMEAMIAARGSKSKVKLKLSPESDDSASNTIHVSNAHSKSAITSDVETPRSAEDGFYQVSPILLKKVLLQVLADQTKWNWDKLGLADNAWMMRTKWRVEWYPDSPGIIKH